MHQPIAFADEIEGTEFLLLVYPDGRAQVTVMAVDGLATDASAGGGARRSHVRPGRRGGHLHRVAPGNAPAEWSHQVMLPAELMSRIHALEWPTPERLPQRTAAHERVAADCLAFARATVPVPSTAVS